MMILGVEIRGLNRLRAKVERVPQVLQDAMWDATFEITELIKGAAELRLASSMKYSTGELIGSLKNEVVIDAQDRIVGRVWSDKIQAIVREFGSGPVGEASPKDLPEGINPTYTQERWFIPAEQVPLDLEAIYGMPRITIQGKDFFITSGQPARPFMYPSLKEILPQAPDVYIEKVQKALRGL